MTNIVVELPVPMSHAALVNMVMTSTETKAQYFAEAGHLGDRHPDRCRRGVVSARAVLADGRYRGPRPR